MRVTYLILFLTSLAFAQNKSRIQVLPNPQSLEDFDHEIKGCPHNSECDQVMGQMLGRWKALITQLKAKSDTLQSSQALENFRAKYGIPVEFYTTQKSLLSFKPLLYNSSCSGHNLKVGEKTLRGTAFVKSLHLKKVKLWRDQSEIELPLSDQLLLQPVEVYFADQPQRYYLPLNDRPLFIKNRELYVLKEEDGFYFMLKISAEGEWKIVHIDMAQLSFWENKREDADCPLKKEMVSKEFGIDFCKNIWDEDTKKSVTARVHSGCIH